MFHVAPTVGGGTKHRKCTPVIIFVHSYFIAGHAGAPPNPTARSNSMKSGSML